MQSIELTGARTNNLKGVDLTVSPGTLLVITGPSGAGKSSLAFATLYAEGQRRYVESFSPYARQFLERLSRPPVERLDPIPAAIAVDRRAQVKTSRSTVGTLTELSDYVRALWVQFSTTVCPRCGAEVATVTPSKVADTVLAQLPEARVVVTYEERVSGPEHYLGVRERLLGEGYRRLFLDGAARDVDDVAPSEVLGESEGEERVEVVLDRFKVGDGDRTRLLEAVEQAFERDAHQAVHIHAVDRGELLRFSHALRCDRCDYEASPPTPSMFSFNSPIGACGACRGFGQTLEPDWDKVMPDLNKTINGGAIRVWSGKTSAHERRLLRRFCDAQGIPRDVPIGQLTKAQRRKLIDGDGGNWRTGYPGLAAWFAWLETKAYKMHVRVMLARYRKYVPCAVCRGTRFSAASLNYLVQGKSIADFLALSAADALHFIEQLMALPEAQRAGSERVLAECERRLRTLCDVGLSYVSLDRKARTLSGGELQRVGLTSALGASLSGTLFVLDEPTVGLHPADVERLVPVVRQLAQRDNVVAVVESDAAFLAVADRVLELGPEGGEGGGELVFDGAPQALLAGQTCTAQALRARPAQAHGHVAGRTGAKQEALLCLEGATGHNLRGADLRIPLGRLTCVTGVSGSGKSSLLVQTLVPALAQAGGDASVQPLPFSRLVGNEQVDHVVVVDQSPMGRTSRGNAATYMGAWDGIRKAFASAELSKERGYKPGYFSFNVAGGRCEACKGEGSETVEMQFLADVQFSCPECQGRRFVGPVLDVQVAGLSIADVLELSATEALGQFSALPEVERALSAMVELGLGYLRLGQPLSTLSGGEGQRLRVAAALSKRLGMTPAQAKKAGHTLFVLDEPTAGLHGSDLTPLMGALHSLTAAGDTVVVVEHDMRVAAQSDHVIDVGPGPGMLGGKVVAEGSPGVVSKARESRTAPYLRAVIEQVPLQVEASIHAGHEGEDSAAVRVRGAREHNLQNVDVDVPREALVVVTGPSGSGKSTLAFDVIFAESQRRYLETLSPYVRQYLKSLPRPDVDEVVGMPPGVSLEQRAFSGAKNSTVGTVTEVAHYLRLGFARAGTLHCPDCEIPIAPRTAAALASDLRVAHGKKRVQLFAPIVRAQRGSHRDKLSRARTQGFTHAVIDGKPTTLTPGMSLDRYKEHDVLVRVAELKADDATLADALSRSLSMGDGVAQVVVGKVANWVSDKRSCASCGRGFAELDPRFFSFNTRQGACPRCEGRGQVETGKGSRKEPEMRTCPTCKGTRLAGLALHVTLGRQHFVPLMAQSVVEAHDSLSALELSEREWHIAGKAIEEARKRLSFLKRVGLSYLSLDRGADTLSGGELQRVRLAAQLGSGLTGLLYVLDEPTIGLHPRDTGLLIDALRQLVGRGCSVLVVEHDGDTIAAADHMLDVGPSGGRGGGRVLAAGPPSELLRNPESVTGRALSAPVAVPARRRPVALKAAGGKRKKATEDLDQISVLGATQNNLKQVDLTIPLGRLTCVTGVSGSGKSTLVREVLMPALRESIGLVASTPGAHGGFVGSSRLRRAVEIDQSPIGRTPRSVPATYVGVWDEIRKILAATPEARARGFGPARFSFNTAGGRCEGCDGQGSTSVEMAFLPDALVPCETCRGLRFDESTLAITYRGLSAGQILQLEIAQAAELFAPYRKVHRPLALLCDLGLGYLQLGQPSNTLSGGEAQRLKLVSELSATEGGGTLYVMDEPTTGLHRSDVLRLCAVIQQLVDRGDTVLVIEHHTDLMMQADFIVDMGPEGGAGGGQIVASGTPEEVIAARAVSHTGAALHRITQQPVR